MSGMARPTFPLRLTDPDVREAVREVAAHEHVSQNEYIEQAIRNDLVVRGELRARQLQAAAERLGQLGAQAHGDLVERSITDFAAGEAGPDPVAMRALHQDAAASAQDARSRPGRRVVGILDSVADYRTR